MRSEGSLTWDEIGKAGIVAAVVAAVGALFAYFRSIGNKVDKAEYAAQIAALRSEFEKAIAENHSAFEKQLEAINRRHSAWEARSERFATREMVDALTAKMDRMETRQDAGFEKLNARLDKLLDSHK